MGKYRRNLRGILAKNGPARPAEILGMNGPARPSWNSGPIGPAQFVKPEIYNPADE